MLVKKYLTPKAERDREDAHATATEQTVLRNLESDIQKLMGDLPKIKRELETATNPDHIKYLNVVINNGEEVLQKKLALHAALSEKFNEDQARRFGIPAA